MTLVLVRYKLKEDPKLLLNIPLGSAWSSPLVALSPDATVVAVSLQRTICIYSCVSGDLLEELDGVHAGGYRDLLQVKYNLCLRVCICIMLGSQWRVPGVCWW